MILTERDAIKMLAGPLGNAELLVRLAFEAPHPPKECVDLSVDTTAAVWSKHSPEERHQAMERLFEWARRTGVSGSVSRLDKAGEDFDTWLTAALTVWLGLYFNGTPRPNLWQTIVDRVDRDGGSVNPAYTWKQYGEVYRIERRRWVEREFRGYERDGRPDYQGLRGVYAVARRPILCLHDEELRIDGVITSALRKANLPTQEIASWLSSASLSKFVDDVGDDDLNLLKSCLAERMARLYCTFQMLSYAKKGYRFVVLWLRDGTVSETRKFEPSSDMQEIVSANEADSGHLPTCLLSTREGVVMELGQPLGSPMGRSMFSNRHEAILKRVEAVVIRSLGDAPERIRDLFPDADVPSQGLLGIR